MWNTRLTQNEVVLTGKGAEAQPPLRTISAGKVPHRDVVEILSGLCKVGLCLFMSGIYIHKFSDGRAREKGLFIFHVSEVW